MGLQRSNVALSLNRNVENSTNFIVSRNLGRLVRLSPENLVMMFRTELVNQRPEMSAHLFLKSSLKKLLTFNAKDVRLLSVNQLLKRCVRMLMKPAMCAMMFLAMNARTLLQLLQTTWMTKSVPTRAIENAWIQPS